MNKLTLNIACGNRTFDEYPKGHKCINLDIRQNLNKVDIVSDVKQLPFENEYFDYILASDIIEHFPFAETKKILTEWKRVLILNGVIEFRLPNLAKICSDYVNNKNTKHISWLLFGGQDYPQNFHYVGFDRKFFKSVVEPIGFKELDYVEKGTNFEMKFRRV